MNLSRNKLSKIANTKYQSRKNRPSKKKNAGASKIRTKFTKKRKIGGKGKNLRKNTMKQKIQFNKKGGFSENELEEKIKEAIGVLKEKEDILNTTKNDEDVANKKSEAAQQANRAAGSGVSKETREQNINQAHKELDDATTTRKNAETGVANAKKELDKAKEELQKAKADAEAEEAKAIEAAAAEAETVPGPGAPALAPALALAQVATQVATQGQTPAPGPVAPGQASNEQTGDNRFKVTLDMLVDNRGNIQLLGAESTKTGKIDTSGVSTIVTLDQSKTTSDSDIKNKPVDDMLKQIVEMLNEMKKQ